MNEENVAQRLKLFIDNTGLTLSQFADQCGIPRPSLSQLLSGRNKKISDVIVGAIHTNFPELSIMWLLFGEGEMYDHYRFPSSDTHEDGEKGVEGSANVDNEPNENKYSNLRALTEPKIVPKSPDYNGVNSEYKILELQRELDKIRKNPRKVVQITIYYDDSTFETFFPGK